MNIVILKGNLTRDPEPKILAGDKSLTEFSIAIDESYKDAKGVKVEKVLYVECQCWGSEKADFLCRYFKKGTPILVNGTKRLARKGTKLVLSPIIWSFVKERVILLTASHLPRIRLTNKNRARNPLRRITMAFLNQNIPTGF